MKFHPKLYQIYFIEEVILTQFIQQSQTLKTTG